MIFRISDKLSKKIKETGLKFVEFHENPFLDWSSHIFTCDRTQYILLTNSKTLFSVVFYGKGVNDCNTFINASFTSLREHMEDIQMEFSYRKFISNLHDGVLFSKIRNKSLLGSINDLIYQSKEILRFNEISPYDLSENFNRIPMKYLKYKTALDVIKDLKVAQTNA